MTAPIKMLFALLSLSASAATAQPGSASQRYIEVTGSADAYLAPTIYYYAITLVTQERNELADYERDKAATPADAEAAKQKNAAMAKQIKELLLQNGVGEQAYIQNKYDVETGDEISTIVVKITDAKQLSALSAKLAASKICRAEVIGVYNPAVEELKETLRAAAFKNAKEEATKLLAASGAKLGAVLQIKDRAARMSDEVSAIESGVPTFNNRRYNGSENGAYTIIPRMEEAANKMISVTQTVFVRFAIE